MAHTLAHELGHGAFGLEHTFDEVPQGSTDNLMDYGSGNRLTHWQWQQIQHPGIIISWFEDADDALFADAAPTITQPQIDLPDQPDWFTQTTYQLLNQYTPYYSATPAQPKTFITTDKQKFTAQVYSYNSGQTLYFEWQDVSYWYINGRWVLSTRNLATEQFYYYDKTQQKLIKFNPKGSESFAEVMNRLGPGLTRFADVWQGVVLGTGGGLLAASGSIYLLIADLSIGVGTAHIDAYRAEISQLDGGQEFLDVYDDVNVALLVFAVSNATVKGAQAVARLESVQSRFAQVVSKIQSSNPALWAKVSGKWGSLSAGLSERASGVSARAKEAYDTYVAKFKAISQKVGLGIDVDLINTFKKRLVIRLQNTTDFTLRHTDDQILQIINKGRELNLADNVIDDLLFISCRDAKPIDAAQVIQQMDNYVTIVLKRGYPYKFTDLSQFNAFKTELKTGLNAIGVSTSDVRIQGSALRTPDANDVDLAAIITDIDFDNFLVNRFTNRITKNGTPIDLSGQTKQQLVDIANDYNSNPNLYNNQCKSFSKAMLERKASAYSSDKIIPGFKELYTSLKSDYPNLNIENITIQTSGGTFDLQPYMNL
ncbi:hypothetical protein [Spirosoma foliorum]|uniref:hypothetical protein n=1 Tax=Spirosoma foliorum TaxID=2710596 RepID=UPI001C70D85B|nr:hypothetical protein [Spirosoma foliorum]